MKLFLNLALSLCGLLALQSAYAGYAIQGRPLYYGVANPSFQETWNGATTNAAGTAVFWGYNPTNGMGYASDMDNAGGPFYTLSGATAAWFASITTAENANSSWEANFVGGVDQGYDPDLNEETYDYVPGTMTTPTYQLPSASVITGPAGGLMIYTLCNGYIVTNTSIPIEGSYAHPNTAESNDLQATTQGDFNVFPDYSAFSAISLPIPNYHYIDFDDLSYNQAPKPIPSGQLSVMRSEKSSDAVLCHWSVQ